MNSVLFVEKLLDIRKLETHLFFMKQNRMLPKSNSSYSKDKCHTFICHIRRTEGNLCGGEESGKKKKIVKATLHKACKYPLKHSLCWCKETAPNSLLQRKL